MYSRARLLQPVDELNQNQRVRTERHMRLRHGHLIAAVGLTLALVSCGAPPTAPPAGSGQNGGDSKFQKYESLKGQERRDTLLKDAKAEGEVSLYTSMTSDVASAVTKAFS